MRGTLSLVVLGLLWGGSLAQELGGIDDEVLLQRLQKGGLVLVFRHGRTDRSQTDELGQRLETIHSVAERQSAFLECSTQRNLSGEGRAELSEVAEAIREIGLLVSEVLSSPMCRTRETAWLLFGQVIPSEMLLGQEGAAERRRFAGSVPPDGGSHVMVTHGGVVRSIVGFPDIPGGAELSPEGYGFVLEPQGESRYGVLARLGPTDWLRLADLAQK